jgi:hypothetical protein
VEVVQPDEHLPGEVLDDWDGDPLVVIALDQGEDVVPQSLEDHAHVNTVRPAVLKMVVQPHTKLFVVGVTLAYLGQQGYLIPGSIGVCLSTLLDLGVVTGQRDRPEWRVTNASIEPSTFIASCWSVWLSWTSHTVEKWPQPSFLKTTYLPPLNRSPSRTGWYPPDWHCNYNGLKHTASPPLRTSSISVSSFVLAFRRFIKLTI